MGNSRGLEIEAASGQAAGSGSPASEGGSQRRNPQKFAKVTNCQTLVVQVFASMVLIINRLESTDAQCPINTMTSFERISGVTVRGSLLTVLYTAPNITSSFGGGSTELSRQLSALSSGSAGSFMTGIPITAECNNRCRRSVKCRAFLVDYSRHTCYSIEGPPIGGQLGGLVRAPTPIQLEASQERTSYFEKVCLNLPFVECERAWVFERVMAHHINGHDDKIIEEVPSRLKCQEYCLNEQEFRCRSGEYDYLTMQCRLSMADRHLKPKSFHLTRSNVDYFENQCVPVGNQCDAFDRYEDMDLGRAEIMRPANTSDQCQQLCTQTIKAFICRSFTWNPLTGKCYLNSMNSNMAGGLDKLLRAPGLTYYQRNDCIDLKLECDTTAMTLNLRTNEPFRGRMYVRDDPNACETIGRSSSLISSLSIPFQSHARCATRELPSRYSSVVVVQQHPLIQRKSDRYIKVVCDFQTANKTITSTYNVIANAWTSTALINATSFAPKIKLSITDKYGIDITGAKLGDELYLRIEAETDSVYDMVARSVLAKSGLTEESIVLIDKDGCPTDFRIFPPLKKLNRRTIVGKFDAFKFSSDVVVRFQVDVQFCLNQCPATTCDHNLLLTNSQTAQLDQYSSSGLLNGPTTSSPSSPLGLDSSLETGAAAAASSTQAPAPFLARTGSSTTPASLDLQYNQPRNISQLNHNHQTDNSLSDPPYQQQQRQPSLPANLPGYGAPNGSQLMLSSLLPGSDSQVFEHSRSAHLTNAEAQQQQQQQQLVEAKAAEETGKQTINTNSQAPDNNELHSGSGANQQQQRRRRRSTEPMPEAPSHVPLQREIIVESSSAPSGRPAGQHRAEGAPASRRRNKSAGAGAVELQQLQRGTRRDEEKADGLTRNGPAYDLNGNNNNKSDQFDEQKLQHDETLGGKAPLLCTTRHSLVLASVAFCTVQFLTIALCLLTWLHRRDAIKFKVRHPAEQRFY